MHIETHQHFRRGDRVGEASAGGPLRTLRELDETDEVSLARFDLTV